MTPARTYLDFERPIAELDSQIEDLLSRSDSSPEKAAQLQEKAKTQLANLYKKIGPWEKTQVSRHPARPHFSEYCKGLISDFTPLAGDRKFGEDEALLGGLGKIRGHSVVIMGHEKGKDTNSRLKHNFGMAHPEGYRKAVRLMEIAARFSLPVITFVDTAGAFPGRGAEERGQAEAIARSIDKGLSIPVPFVSAVAIATADKIMMLEHSVYSVISPEGCASILWRDRAKAEDAAKAMKITAQDLKRLKIIDHIIKEPIGGAHRSPEKMIKTVGSEIVKALEELMPLEPKALIKRRREKFLNIGRSLL